MRVLEILPSISAESGGPVRSTLANCRALLAADPGIRLTLATTDCGLQSNWRETLEARMPPAMDLRVFPSVGRHTIMFSPRLASWLGQHVAGYDLVVIQALLHPVSSVAAWISRLRKVPYLVVPHGTLSPYTFHHRRTLLKWAYFGLIERRTIAGAAGVRFTSEGERRDAGPRVSSTISWVVAHPFEPRFDLGQKYEGGTAQILFLSRWDPVKGLNTLLEAFSQLLPKEPRARLVLAGSGGRGFERRIRGLVSRLGIRDAVSLPGFIQGESKARLLRNSAVFVLASWQENFGIAVVEAMDAGLPVVITKGVDIWPEVEAAGAGIVVDGRSPDALAAALWRLLRDPALRHQMGRRGQVLVRSAFDPITIGRRLSELYHSAAEHLPHPHYLRERTGG